MLSRSESFAKLDCLLLPGGDSLSFPAENKQRADNQSDQGASEQQSTGQTTETNSDDKEKESDKSSN